MPKPPPPSLPRTTTAAAATFDPWNSSSTGHQRPDHRPGTAWRDSRTRKVNSQFRGGEARIRGAWGSGTERHGSDKEARRVIGRRGASVVDMLKKPGLMKNMEESLGGDEKKKEKEKEKKQEKSREGDEIDVFAGSRKPRDEDGDARRRERGIFYGTVIYVNGSTYPLISDHKLKHLVSENGGQLSLHLARRKVTHVILGRPATGTGTAAGGTGAGACGGGGGLAGGKMDREIRKMRGCGVYFVDVEWVLESLRAGKRLSEARFSNVKIAAMAQGSVYGSLSSKA